jgi:ADP-ribose pyrophosphatase YjhB (NUDIX family)
VKYLYCYHCGTKTISKTIDGRQRSYCERCNLPLYENPVPSVAVVITNQLGQVLLVRRNVEPGIGEWCLPGGFIEIGETPQQAAVREINEEIGININDPQLLGIGSHLNGYYGDVLIIGFHVKIDAGVKMIPGDDVSEAGFFSINDRPKLIFRVHEDFLTAWMKKQGNQV